LALTLSDNVSGCAIEADCIFFRHDFVLAAIAADFEGERRLAKYLRNNIKFFRPFVIIKGRYESEIECAFSLYKKC
jgi:hypothetical protein